MACDLSKHDFTKPYTAEEVEELKRVFREMPSFIDSLDGGHIVSRDLADYYTKIGYHRTPEQHDAYRRYWDRHFGGKVLLNESLDICNSWHDTLLFTKQCVRVYDLDKDGFISPREFDEFVKLCKLHDPKLEHITYAEFLQLADANKDGKVSLEEFGEWIERSLKE